MYRKFLTILLAMQAPLCAAEPAQLLDIRIGEETYTGTVAGKTDKHFWLLQRDGRLEAFSLHAVSDYTPLKSAFRPLSSADLRDVLVAEFGRGYEVAGSAHYLVVAGRGDAKRYVGLFEELYRHVHVYFTARGFSIREPEFPLVAIVFPDRAKFAEYCRSERVNPAAGLMGYYLQTSNRVALYDSASTGDLDDTIIHEAVHQVAFNLGLHRRIGSNPKWVVEGLATAFEPENFRNPMPTTPAAAKINRDRFSGFRNYLAGRRPKKALEDFVSSDDRFQSAPLDAYAEAWALTFFLLQTRQEQYARYLKQVSARRMLEEYSPEERLTDFQQAFGKNVSQLEVDFLRYHQGLK